MNHTKNNASRPESKTYLEDKFDLIRFYFELFETVTKSLFILKYSMLHIENVLVKSDPHFEAIKNQVEILESSLSNQCTAIKLLSSLTLDTSDKNNQEI